MRRLAVLCVLLAAPASAGAEPLTPTWLPLPPGRGTVVTADPASRVLFLNRCRGGCTIHPGNDDSRVDESSIIWRESQLAAFPHGDAAWQRVVDCVRTLYSPFDVEVTDVDPGDQPHFEAMVAGDPGDLDMPRNVGGVAPFACGVIENSVSFTFADALGGSPELICEVIGQESAHTFGLDHEMLCSDPMTYLRPCGAKCFQDQSVACGEYEDRECYCGGASQDSYAYLMQVFGPGQGTPAVRFESPRPGDLVAPGFHLRVSPLVPCGGAVQAWVEAKAGDVYLGEVNTWPYILDTPGDLPVGPLRIRIEVAGPDGDPVVSTLDVVLSNDIPDAGVRPRPDAGTTATGGGGGAAGSRPAAGAALLVLLVAIRRRATKRSR